tara:strand:- start:2520 stop:2723 length:204 start_codon:yes stop_codon:yes gene_type:complete
MEGKNRNKIINFFILTYNLLVHNYRHIKISHFGMTRLFKANIEKAGVPMNLERLLSLYKPRWSLRKK